MKRLLALLAGGLGLGALLRRRSRAASPAPAASPADDLRAKLDATKAPGEDTASSEDTAPSEDKAPAEEQPAGQANAGPSADPSPETPDVDARRADVHARARQAMDDLGETTKTEQD